jgi:hypothetical protein
MRVPARRLARTSTRGKVLHIIDWRKELDGRPPSLCDLTLMYEPGTADVTLPICKACLKAEEAIRAQVVFSDIKVSRLTIEGMTVPQALLAILQNGVPGTAIIAIEGGCSCCPGGTAVVEWYETSEQAEAS